METEAKKKQEVAALVWHHSKLKSCFHLPQTEETSLRCSYPYHPIQRFPNFLRRFLLVHNKLSRLPTIFQQFNLINTILMLQSFCELIFYN